MDKAEAVGELNKVVTKLGISLQKLMMLQNRSRYMTAEEIMQEMMIILSFGDDLNNKKPSIIV